MATSIIIVDGKKKQNPEYFKAYYEENKEKRSFLAMQWAKKNKEKIKIQAKKRYPFRQAHTNFENRRKNPIPHMLARAKQRAKRKGLEFNINVSDIIIPEYCPLLNIKIEFSLEKRLPKRGKCLSSPSLDRIDNSKGYIKGNVRVISNMANMMKGAASKEQLKTFAINILKEQGEIHGFH